MKLINKASSGGKIANTPTDPAGRGDTFEETIKSNKNIQIMQRRVANSKKNVLENSNNSSVLSYHSSSVDEDEIYDEAGRYLKNKGFDSLKNKYIETDSREREKIRNKALMVLNNVQEEKSSKLLS